ncbi:MAG: DUF763 domain-containing protein [Actinomycetota bacterium]|nr:DUF763 domain-containing protein [Actinomycetota bacterium]
MRSGRADLPLHGGRAPAWLFERMVPLARAISLAIIENEGPHALLTRLSDPFWFQAFGCVLGFDWHSSGLTTTACGALKEGLRGLESDAGLSVAGGKGKASRRTPVEIERYCERVGLDATPLVAASRMSAKVDSSAVQDGYQVYHHTFVCSEDGSWAVVQQGMNEAAGMARRYHWHDAPRFDSDPHSAVAGDPADDVLNLVAGEAEDNRATSAALAREEPGKLVRELERMKTLSMPRRHEVRLEDLDPTRIERVLLKAYEAQPEDFTHLLAVPGVGAKGLRALALVAEVAYGSPASIKDPASFSWAHGGKDGTPFPVDRPTYDSTIASLEATLAEARAGRSEKKAALQRLGNVRELATSERRRTSSRDRS